MFDIDLHIYARDDADLQARIIIEKRFEYIGGSASGSKGSMKKFSKLYKKVYSYYGVTQKDMDQNTKRYEDVVKCLAMRS